MARKSTTSVTQPSVKAFLVCYRISKERKLDLRSMMSHEFAVATE